MDRRRPGERASGEHAIRLTAFRAPGSSSAALCLVPPSAPFPGGTGPWSVGTALLPASPTAAACPPARRRPPRTLRTPGPHTRLSRSPQRAQPPTRALHTGGSRHARQPPPGCLCRVAPAASVCPHTARVSQALPAGVSRPPSQPHIHQECRLHRPLASLLCPRPLHSRGHPALHDLLTPVLGLRQAPRGLVSLVGSLGGSWETAGVTGPASLPSPLHAHLTHPPPCVLSSCAPSRQGCPLPLLSQGPIPSV